METCEHEQVSDRNKVVFEQRLDWMWSRGWKTEGPVRIERKKDDSVLFVADMVRLIGRDS
jgi:hypothetical protein